MSMLFSVISLVLYGFSPFLALYFWFIFYVGFVVFSCLFYFWSVLLRLLFLSKP